MSEKTLEVTTSTGPVYRDISSSRTGPAPGENRGDARRDHPRVLYVGDLEISTTAAGSLILHRLLHACDPAKVMIIEDGGSRSDPAKRLPDATYLKTKPRLNYLKRTRFAPLYGSWLLETQQLAWRKLARMSRAFAPQAILTVVHGHSWLAAAKLAERLDVPLHLVLHDELTRHCLVHPAWKDRLQSRFARVWQQAASRLCVSPYMRESYEMRFGAKGEILYPGRSHDGPAYADPAPVAADRPFTVAYAGSLHALSSYRDLAEVARRLDAMNGRLLVCSWLREDWLRDSGLNRPNVTIARQPTSAHLVHFLRRQADVMLLSMSFDPVDRLNVELNFPSKLTDYTCTGLPIVAWGPAYSSGLRWASAHPGVAEVVVGADASDLLRVLQLLRSDPARRQALAKRAIEVGARMFSYDTVSSQFVSALSRPRV